MKQPQVIKIAVFGLYRSGTSTFVDKIGGNDFYGDGQSANFPAYVGSQYQLDADFVLEFHVPGDTNQFEFYWREIANPELFGLILIVDSAAPALFKEAHGYIAGSDYYSPRPFIIAANKQDVDGAWPIWALRIVLQIPDEVPLIPCVATDLESVKNVLLVLCDEALKRLDQLESEPSSE